MAWVVCGPSLKESVEGGVKCCLLEYAFVFGVLSFEGFERVVGLCERGEVLLFDVMRSSCYKGLGGSDVVEEGGGFSGLSLKLAG